MEKESWDIVDKDKAMFSQIDETNKAFEKINATFNDSFNEKSEKLTQLFKEESAKLEAKINDVISKTKIKNLFDKTTIFSRSYRSLYSVC